MSAPSLDVVFTFLIVAALSAWLVLTLLNQFEAGRRLVASFLRYDIFALVPIWTFFAPNPGRTDTHILYRDLDEDGGLSLWRVLPLTSRPGAFGSSRGERRVAKAVVDVQHELLDERFAAQEEVEPAGEPTLDAQTAEFRRASPIVLFSTPYLAILNLVTRAPHDIFAVGTQFAIACSDSPDVESRAQVLFVSAQHDLQTDVVHASSRSG